MHGSGVRSLSYLMDEIIMTRNRRSSPTVQTFAEALELVRPACRWSQGTWKFHNGEVRKWNEIQNLGRDRELLTRYLCDEYRRQTR